MTKTRSSFLEKLSLATYGELFFMWMLINIICTVWYFGLATVGSASAPSHLTQMDTAERLFNSFYFSIITATSLGYGDILPFGFSKVLAMVQSILALMIFALFVTKLVSQRQDRTLAEVHRMTSESKFYDIRQGLFLVRKDFDALMIKVRAGKKLEDADWELLTMTYLHAHNLIEEIPNLYNGQGQNLYVIDEKREKLLIESIDRTLQRLKTFLALMTKEKITWKKNAESLKEYKDLISALETMMPLWRKRSPTKKNPSFEKVVAMIKELKKVSL
jgi:hypothetical protein